MTEGVSESVKVGQDRCLPPIDNVTQEQSEQRKKKKRKKKKKTDVTANQESCIVEGEHHTEGAQMVNPANAEIDEEEDRKKKKKKKHREKKARNEVDSTGQQNVTLQNGEHDLDVNGVIPATAADDPDIGDHARKRKKRRKDKYSSNQVDSSEHMSLKNDDKVLDVSSETRINNGDKINEKREKRNEEDDVTGDFKIQTDEQPRTDEDTNPEERRRHKKKRKKRSRHDEYEDGDQRPVGPCVSPM